MLCSLIERWLIYGSDEKLDTDSRYGAFSSVAWLTGDQVVFFLDIIYLLFVRCQLAQNNCYLSEITSRTFSRH